MLGEKKNRNLPCEVSKIMTGRSKYIRSDKVPGELRPCGKRKEPNLTNKF